MLEFAGYKDLEILHEGRTSRVLRGIRVADDLPIILKAPVAGKPTRGDLESVRMEYELIRGLDIEGVVKPYGLEETANTSAIVFADIGGEPLEHYSRAGAMRLSDFLFLAVRVTKILAEIHQRDVIHNQINPKNIVWNRDDDIVQIIDFGTSTKQSHEFHDVIGSDISVETLSYISPEQTGRLNRVVDHRTDLYSLGATFYELLCGRSPFASKDPLELVHFHIAKEPATPRAIDATIPAAISGIVMKLLSKSPDDRYQSADGLKVDLEECRRRLRATQDIEPFELGLSDKSERLYLPEKSFGRDREIRLLLEAFDRASKGKFEVALVSGSPGIGKTKLVHEIQRPVIRSGGYFIKGKFEQIYQGIPYNAIASAFRDLIRQLLLENEERLGHWRRALLASMGPNGQVIIDVIPDVELIVGPQPDVLKLPPYETQNRFNIVFQNFFQSFISEEHPLVLFLDDLQWIDDASLQLLEILFKDPDLEHFLFIGTYRDTDVDDSHAFHLGKERMLRDSYPVNDIALSPLDRDGINHLLSDTFHTSRDETADLSDLVVAKTNGNPFFIIEFLKKLRDDSLIEFARDWNWDLSKIREANITDNVADLMSDKLMKIPASTRDVIKTMACIGVQCQLSMLSAILGKKEEEILGILETSVNEGMLLRINENIRFSHDRIRESVYSLIDPEEAKGTHYLIGTKLSTSPEFENLQDSLGFIITNQFNLSRDLLSEEDKETVAALNLKAGRQAAASAAFESAASYFGVGIELLSGNCWEKQYPLALALYTEKMKMSYLSGEFEESERLGDVVLLRARTVIEKVEVYETRILVFKAQTKMIEAIKCAQEILKMLGISLPLHPGKLHIISGFIKTKSLLKNKTKEELLNLPKMTDPHKLACMRILGIVDSAAYLAVPELIPILTFKSVGLSVKYGNAPVSPFYFVHFGIILGKVTGDFDASYQYGELALSLLERIDAKEFETSAVFLKNACITHWKDPLRDTLPILMEAHQTGLETGNLEYGCYALNVYAYHSFYSGVNLADLDETVQTFLDITKKYKHETSHKYCMFYRQTMQNLLGKAEDPRRLVGRFYNEDQMLEIHFKENDIGAILQSHVAKLLLAYHFDDYGKAVDHAAVIREYSEGMPGTAHVSVANFYESLAHLAGYSDASKKGKRRILRLVEANQKKMKNWADYAAQNHLHKYYIVQAELMRVERKADLAMQYYRQGAELARDNGYLHEEALANELCAQFFCSIGLDDVADIYLRKAYAGYEDWGAQAKLKQLENRYGRRLDLARTTVTETLTGTTAEIIDLSTIIKSSQDLASEFRIEKLLEKIMNNSMENAGAQRAFLILEQEGEARIEAAASIEEPEETAHRARLSERREYLSESIVRFVIRNREHVILNDATKDNRFLGDPYIAKERPKSILSIPIHYQNEQLGALYLENNLTTNAFTEDHVRVLNVLLTQAAISLENAKLFAYQKEVEHALRESEEKWRSLVENAPNMIMNVDPEGKIQFINRTVPGFTVDEIIGTTVYNYIPPDYHQTIREKIEEVFKTGKSTYYELKGSGAHGKEAWYITHIGPIRHNDRIVAVTLITADITDRRIAEEELRRLRNLFSNIVNSMPSIMIGVDRDIRVTQWNRETQKSTNISAKDALGRPLREVFPQLEGEIKKVRQAIQQSVQLKNERISMDQGGETRFTDITIYPLVTNGAEGAVIRIDDVTERIRIEEMMIQSEKMLSVGGLAAGIAHEINNPLAGIIQNMQVISNRLFEEIPANLRAADRAGTTFDVLQAYTEDRGISEMVENVRKSSLRAAKIVDNMLSFSRKSEGAFAMHNLSELLDKTLELASSDYDLKKKFDFRKIDISREYEAAMPKVSCDSSKMQQVFLNILKNGAQAMAELEESEEPDRFVLRIMREDDVARVEIENNGPEIDDAIRKRVFEPFFTTKEIGIGTGLGLSVSYFIITENHNGTMEVETTPQGGTKFIIRLPMQR